MNDEIKTADKVIEYILQKVISQIDEYKLTPDWRGEYFSSNQLEDLRKVFDMTTAMTRLDGDKELFRELADMFLKDCTKQMSDIKDAITQGNSKALEKSSHSIKGSVGTFCAQPAHDAAFNLEMMGRANNLTNAMGAYALLEREIGQLKLLLTAYSKEV